MKTTKPQVNIGPVTRKHLVDKLGDERASTLPCPMLSILVMEDILVPDADGNVSTSQLKDALEQIGIAALPRFALAHGTVGIVGNSDSTLNLFELFRSKIDHKGSLGPLQDGGFNQVFLDRLRSFSKDGQRLTIDDLAAAQLSRLKEDGAETRDKVIGYVEITALTMVVGKGSPKALMLDDLNAIFKDNRLPENWQKPNVHTFNLAWNIAKLAFAQNTSSAAMRAEKGLRDALGEPSRLDQTSMKSLAAMCPAGMRPKGGQGITEGEFNHLHQELAKVTNPDQHPPDVT